MNKKISKIILFILITFVLISSLAMLLKEKNTKINNKHLKLNYELSYEEAFPDKEFRRLILSFQFYKPDVYTSEGYSNYNGSIFDIFNKTGDDTSAGADNVISDADFEKLSKEKLNENFLDSIQIVHAKESITTWKNISNLQGIEYLKNLKFFALFGSKITNADFSQNSKLESLLLTEKFYYSGGYTTFTGQSKLKNVNIKNNLELKNLALILDHDQDNIIDLSNNTKLEALYLEASNLKEIDLSNNKALENVNINWNKLQKIKKLDKCYSIFHQSMKVTVEKGVPTEISLNVRNKEVYLNNSSDFTRSGNLYTFNKNFGKYSYSFHDKELCYGGTVEVTLTGGEAKKYKPIVNINNKVYVGENFTYSSIIANYPPKTRIDKELDNSSKGLKTVKFTSIFDDGSEGSYEVQIPVFEKNIKEIEPFKPIYPKSKYIEGEFAKNLLLSYSEVQDERDDYLNILNKKSKCNYETYICDIISYKIEAFYRSIGDKAISDKPIPGKAYDYFSVNNTAILDSKVKVYNSKQMEQVVRNYLNGSSLIDWQGDENQKVFYIYNQWLNGVPNILETTILRDTDGDKIPDVDDEDDDNDGVSDEQEVLDQTDPKDITSFKVTKICYKVKG